MADVLLVDDDAGGRVPLGRYLEHSGHSVRTVPDGRAALVAVILRTPDVVVLDMFMPDTDGPSFPEVLPRP